VPAQTEANIRQQLEQSRGQLLYKVGNDIVLQSPANGMTVDANNGPVAVVHNIFERKGQKTFLCDFTVTTDINEAGKFVKLPPVVISHVWRMRNIVGDDSFTTRVITGNIVCRSDLLALNNAIPDDFRQTLAFAVPTNFQRTNIDVVAAEDGNSCEYTLIDQERPTNISVRNGIIRIESTWEQTFSMVGASEISWMETKNDIAIAQGAFKTVTESKNFFDLATSAVGFSANASVKSADLARNAAPRVVHSLSCQMWGNRSINLPTLNQNVWQFLAARFAVLNATFGQVFASFSLGNKVNHMARYAAGAIHFFSGPLKVQGGIVNIGAGFGLGFVNQPADANVGAWITVGDSDNPPQLGRGGVSGGYLGAVVAAALQGQNILPLTPTQQGFAANLSGGRTAKNLGLIGV
jgi:hypothetical protein